MFAVVDFESARQRFPEAVADVLLMHGNHAATSRPETMTWQINWRIRSGSPCVDLSEAVVDPMSFVTRELNHSIEARLVGNGIASDLLSRPPIEIAQHYTGHHDSDPWDGMQVGIYLSNMHADGVFMHRVTGVFRNDHHPVVILEDAAKNQFAAVEFDEHNSRVIDWVELVEPTGVTRLGVLHAVDPEEARQVVENNRFLNAGPHLDIPDQITVFPLDSYGLQREAKNISTRIEDGFVYHMTPAENIPSILTDGLLPSIGERSAALGETKAASYHFVTLDAAENALSNWFGESFDDDVALCMLAVDKSRVVLTHDEAAGYEAVCHQVISPDALRILSVDLDQMPDFSKFKSYLIDQLKGSATVYETEGVTP